MLLVPGFVYKAVPISSKVASHGLLSGLSLDVIECAGERKEVNIGKTMYDNVQLWKENMSKEKQVEVQSTNRS